MKSRTKKCLSVAIAAAMGVGLAVNNASATALAQSTLLITNLLFMNAAGTATLDASAFDTLIIQDSTNLNPSLNGVFNPYTNNTVGGVPLAQTTVCVPVNCALLAQPAPYGNATTPPTADGALGASALNGAPITGIGQPTGANASTEALAELINPGVANSSANLGLIAQFSFSLATDQAVTISFDALAHEIAFMDSVLLSANAGMGWTMDVINQATGVSVFHWAPDGVVGTGITGGTESADACNLQVSRGVIGPGSAPYDCSGHEQALSNVLLASQTYTLTIAHQNRADVLILAVPEPATLALVAVGLLGAGFTARRKNLQK